MEVPLTAVLGQDVVDVDFDPADEASGVTPVSPDLIPISNRVSAVIPVANRNSCLPSVATAVAGSLSRPAKYCCSFRWNSV